MNNSTLFLNGLKKATVFFKKSAIIGMAGNASFIIIIIVLSFLLFLHYSGYFDCLFKNEINYVKG